MESSPEAGSSGAKVNTRAARNRIKKNALAFTQMIPADDPGETKVRTPRSFWSEAETIVEAGEQL
jgi:hypothetical protein